MIIPVKKRREAIHGAEKLMTLFNSLGHTERFDFSFGHSLADQKFSNRDLLLLCASTQCGLNMREALWHNVLCLNLHLRVETIAQRIHTEFPFSAKTDLGAEDEDIWLAELSNAVIRNSALMIGVCVYLAMQPIFSNTFGFERSEIATTTPP